jgi:hypothetical protein
VNRAILSSGDSGFSIRAVDHLVIRVLDQIIERQNRSVDALFLEQVQVDIGEDHLLLIDVTFGRNPFRAKK